MRVVRSLSLFMFVIALLACGKSGLGKDVRDDVSARMVTAQDPIASCYEAALQRNRKLAGKMVLQFVAESNTGKFKNIQVQQSDLDDDELEQCVVKAVSTLALAKPQKTEVAVTYPLEFSPLE